MTDEQPNPPRALTDIQRDRIDFARRDLDSARAENLEHLEAAGLILMVERLRGRLGDALDLIEEITDL
ncbi:hypothetical protein [Streptomyces sp. NPDC005549]|uniref:hypothetical protein n=1 Tax=Streptomyces sp. NPDC005549 TaxID=3154888 RepID=UPI0033AD695C